MGEVAIDCFAARPTIYSPFVRFVKHNISLLFRLYGQAGCLWARLRANTLPLVMAQLILEESADSAIGVHKEGSFPWLKSEF